jgi:hypothetical protein
MTGFEIDALDRAIEIDRSLVRVRAMRHSVYTFPHDQLVVALTATRREGVQMMKSASRSVGDAYFELATAVESALADAEGPLPSAEIREKVDSDKKFGGRFSLILARMAVECRVVRATNTGGWRSNRLTYARWADWLPDLDPFVLEEDDARRQLAEIYVSAYGPVELEDLRWWTGWTKTNALAAADELDLGMAGSAMRQLEGVRLLPVWDVLMVAYRNRDRLFDPEHARFIYDRMGNATSVVLDEGRVVGVWDLGRTDDPLMIQVAPLDQWPSRRWDKVEEQAQRIGEMIGASTVEVARIDEPVDLSEAPRNRFLSPLSN